jgi:hypothetical protein
MMTSSMKCAPDPLGIKGREGSRFLDSGCLILDTDTGFWMLDTGFWILDSGYKIASQRHPASSS